MENKHRDKFRSWVERFGGVCFVLHGHGMQAPGIPDMHIASRWWVGWIEFKAKGNTLSAAQRIKGRALERFGAFFVVRFREGGSMTLENSDEEVLETFPFRELSVPNMLHKCAEWASKRQQGP